jgi:uncharacterized protein
MTLSDEARNFNWLLNSFVDQTAGVTDAVAVSSDGLLMAASSSLDRASAEQLAAIISGFVSLGHGASRCFDFAGLEQIIVAMRQGFLFVSSISDGSCLGVVATRNCDIGLVGYQTTLLVERAGQVLTPGYARPLPSAHGPCLAPARCCPLSRCRPVTLGAAGRSGPGTESERVRERRSRPGSPVHHDGGSYARPAA